MKQELAKLAAIACVVVANACGGDMSATTTDKTAAFGRLQDVTPEQWSRLANKQLFFGHQSVGGNLIQGVEEILAKNPKLPLKTFNTADPTRIQGPGIFHARIGQNGKPETKLATWRDIVSQSVGNSGVAMLKYCYVDITADTDPNALFQSYRAAVESLRREHPALEIVHVTLPLKVDRGLIYHWRTIMNGNTSERQLNLTRRRYNDLLRKTYAGREPLFDLALLEATGPDGKLRTIRYKGEQVPVLAAEWTHDGGHLNEIGRQRAAEAFLFTLANL